MVAVCGDFYSTVKEAIIRRQSHCDALRQGRCMSELTLFSKDNQRLSERLKKMGVDPLVQDWSKISLSLN